MTDTQPARTGVDRLAYEKSTVAPFVGLFGWRSIFNFIWPVVGWVTVVVAVSSGRLPLAIGFVLAVVFLQALYMPVHEAVHSTISGGRQQYAWVDRSIGVVASTLLGASFEEHRLIHLAHHTHTNDDGDPDLLFSKGTMVEVVGKVLGGAALIPVVTVLSLIPHGTRILPGSVRSLMETADELRGPTATSAATRFARLKLVALVVGTVAGFGIEVWLLWFAAASVAHAWLAVVFAWLPHHPHSEVGRYRDTRIFTFRSSTWLIRGHDHHLLHHLFPRVPHYRLRSLYSEIDAHLEEQGARLEGRAGSAR